MLIYKTEHPQTACKVNLNGCFARRRRIKMHFSFLFNIVSVFTDNCEVYQ